MGNSTVAVVLAWNREWCFHSPQYAAIQAKLNNQAAYAVWRQDVAVQGRHISGRKDEWPATDPGAVVIYRWRRRNKSAADCKKNFGGGWH